MTNAEKTEHQYRIAFLGACRVGKTSIVNQLVYNRSTRDYEPTLETDIDYMAKYNDHSLYCLLVDTYGGYDFPAMRRLSITRCRAFIVVFSLTDQNTYFEAKKQIDEIRKTKTDDHVNIVLVGNKQDITEGDKILTEEIFLYCDSLYEECINCRFIKVSAMDRDDVINMFNVLLDMITPELELLSSSPRRGGFMHRRSRSNSVADKKKSLNHSPNLINEPIVSIQPRNRSPSLYSLHNFSSDDDITEYSNYLNGEENKKKGLFSRSKPIEITPPSRKLSVCSVKHLSSSI